tara:strand:+ start:9080 stop:9340 length:261 start_codon:yes stop_codon:yes gene_type:complete
MIRYIINLVLIVFVSFFIALIISEYNSKSHKEKLILNRDNVNRNLVEKTKNLDILRNDTNNIIKFNNGYDNNEKKNNRKFWELFSK